VVLTLCNLIPKKGIDKVMEAVEILADEHDILYVVAGVGPDRKRLEGLAEKLGISSRVVFTGRVPENRIASLYAACDIFVMPTRIEADGSVEGFGIVYLEAGSQGVPVIGPRIGGSADAIEDGVTGYLVDAADVSEIARRMRQLLENPALARQMGSAGRERATRPTDWAPVTEWN
jgi:phosphatidylinositol alpha-1,6-mannosyltransferase